MLICQGCCRMNAAGWNCNVLLPQYKPGVHANIPHCIHIQPPFIAMEWHAIDFPLYKASIFPVNSQAL